MEQTRGLDGLKNSSQRTRRRIQEETLSTEERDRIEAVIELCRKARERLRPDAPFRLRVLLDMTLLELAKELARSSDDRAA